MASSKETRWLWIDAESELVGTAREIVIIASSFGIDPDLNDSGTGTAGFRIFGWSSVGGFGRRVNVCESFEAFVPAEFGTLYRLMFASLFRVMKLLRFVYGFSLLGVVVRSSKAFRSLGRLRSRKEQSMAAIEGIPWLRKVAYGESLEA